MRRYRFDFQVLLVLLFVAAIFVAALFIRVVENPLGIFSEPNELLLSCDDLQGLRERAELRCRGAIVGHVKKIEWGGEQFSIKAGISNRYKDWSFAPRGHIQGAVMQSAVTPSWIELLPPQPNEPAVVAGPLAPIELIPAKQKAGAEGLMEKVTEIGDAVLDLVHVVNPPKADANVARPDAQATPTPPIQKIVRMIDDMSETSRSMREFALRLKEKSTDEELNHALQELKNAVAKLHEHVTEADGAIEETKAAMNQFKKAAKSTELSTQKFNDLVDRVGDTTMGRMLIRKKSPSPSPSPGPRR